MGKWTIIVREVLPNILPVIVITLSTTVGWMILETAGLSFLGLGSQPPQADLGSMLGEGRKLLINAPHASIVPGVMIFLIVMSVNLLGDGIRDALDPRLRAGALSRPAASTRVERRIASRAEAKHDAPTTAKALLEVTDLRTEFQVASRTYKAVNGVSFCVQRGECLGIVGESGSGKSVTALSLLGLVASPPGVITAGSVELDGADTLSMTAESLRQVRGNKVAYIFQDPLATLHPLYRIGDQLVEAIRVHRSVPRQQAWKEAVELLDQVRIPNAGSRAKSFPHELSGGMRQRVGIALALVNDPELIIADEPTTALDVTVQAQILTLLDELRREKNLSLVFITHDFGVVAQLCDRIAVMYAGRVVETGLAHDVLESPRHPYTRRLIACVPELGGGQRVLESISGFPPSLHELPAGCAFAERCDRAQPPCRDGEIALLAMSETQSVRCLFPESGA
jgi:peptide/nickel transport system permease protein